MVEPRGEFPHLAQPMSATDDDDDDDDDDGDDIADDADDGEDCDDPATVCLDDMPERVPRHSINASIDKKFKNNINTSLLIKYASERRDYGNGNNGYNDVLLSEYITVDIMGSYNVFNNYNMFFSATNLFDNDYEEAFQYSNQGKSVKIGLKRIY